MAPTHIFANPLAGWGHVRPCLNLCVLLAKFSPDVHCTVLVNSVFHGLASLELARSLEDESLASRVRLVSGGDVSNFLGAAPGHEADFENMWRAIDAGKEVTCASTGKTFPALPKPSVVIIDSIAIDAHKTIREVSGDSVKIYTNLVGMLAATLQTFSPKYIGGRGSIDSEIKEEVARTGKSYDEVGMEFCLKSTGRVVKVPGLPPMYDYEANPQQFTFPGYEAALLKMYTHVFDLIESTAGAFLITAESYEPEAVAAVRDWFGKTGRPVYAMGPLLPPSSVEFVLEKEKAASLNGPSIFKFLDDTLATSGPNSVLYMSLGSAFWPVSSPEKLWAVLDVIMELNIPFIFSHASPMAQIPDEMRAKVDAYGKGVLSPWSPQQSILHHPATGWYISHGGHNSVTEAIVAGVPMIMWPFTGDQAQNACTITDNWAVGYELLEVRTGDGLKPICRTGYTPVGTVEAVTKEAREVLGKAFGEDGKKKRAALAPLTKAMQGEWEENGTAKKDLLAFLSTL
ncbi:UDP-Glycosyltransferase/glycogen phosphorylase [Epithele typhae]|uniref:UDP-Glycosyltransferase/glycogen phosphorylase n=1 Tax=Epithele typhae TaxID=378194 RepID=UPI002008A7B6|nr:UDP-Glycosyltransferase/glycogen phosphorylase [Epithele typhae]KAH9940501.1 UDP-Glycosyltransferase/glycogen phosphorylase [Epithele typhae]